MSHKEHNVDEEWKLPLFLLLAVGVVVGATGLILIYLAKNQMIASFIAIVTGFMGLGAAKSGAGGKGMAIAGMMLGMVYFLILILTLILLFVFGGLSVILQAL